MLHCLFEMKQVPIAPHLFYPHVLDESDPRERNFGITAGIVLLEHCDKVAAYCDHGMSEGMTKEVSRAIELGKEVDIRYILGKVYEHEKRDLPASSG